MFYIGRNLLWPTLPETAALDLGHPLAWGMRWAWVPTTISARQVSRAYENISCKTTSPSWTVNLSKTGMGRWGKCIETVTTYTVGGLALGYLWPNYDSCSVPTSKFELIQFRALGPDATLQFCNWSSAYYARLNNAGYEERWYHNSGSSFSTGILTDVPIGRPFTCGTTKGVGGNMANHSLYWDGNHRLNFSWPQTPSRNCTNVGVFGDVANKASAMLCGLYLYWVGRALTQTEYRQLTENPFQVFYVPKRYFLGAPSAPSGAISGSCAVSAGGASTASGTGRLECQAQGATVAGASTLQADGALAGTSAALWGGSATASTDNALAGTATSAFDVAGTMSGKGSAGGTSPTVASVSAAILGHGDLAGGASAIAGGTAALEGVGSAAGVAEVAFGGSAFVSSGGAIAGNATVTVAVNALVRGQGRLSASSAVTAALTATVHGRSGLTGEAAVSVSCAGTVSATALVSGTSTASIGGVSFLTGIGMAPAGPPCSFNVSAASSKLILERTASNLEISTVKSEATLGL